MKAAEREALKRRAEARAFGYQRDHRGARSARSSRWWRRAASIARSPARSSKPPLRWLCGGPPRQDERPGGAPRNPRRDTALHHESLRVGDHPRSPPAGHGRRRGPRVLDRRCRHGDPGDVRGLRFSVVSGARRSQLVSVIAQGIERAERNGMSTGSARASLAAIASAPATVLVLNPSGRHPATERSVIEWAPPFRTCRSRPRTRSGLRLDRRCVPRL